MREIDKRTRLSRRGFLTRSSAAALGVSALTGTRILVDAGGAWAMGLNALKPEAARTLIRMARDLYPHDHLGDTYYAKAIQTIDAAAAKDTELAALLNEGAEALDKAARSKGGSPYADMPEEADRLVILRSFEQTPFFQKVRGDMVVALYNQPEVWAKLGYEGPSVDKGGYLHRGFDDIDWLQDA